MFLTESDSDDNVFLMQLVPKQQPNDVLNSVEAKNGFGREKHSSVEYTNIRTKSNMNVCKKCFPHILLISRGRKDTCRLCDELQLKIRAEIDQERKSS